MRTATRRIAAVLAVTGALAAATVGPIAAQAPTPHSLGMPGAAEYTDVGAPDDDCIIGDRCLYKFWIRVSTGMMMASSGYVKGHHAAKVRAKESGDLFANIAPGAPREINRVTHKYKVDGKWRKLILKVIRVTRPATADEPLMHAEIAVGRQLTRKNGNQGSYRKSVGLGVILIAINNDPIPDALNARSFRKLGKQTRNLIHAGSGYELTGPVSST